MQWARFRWQNGRAGFGLLEDTHVVEFEGELFGSSVSTGRRIALGDIILESPCLPSKVVGLWNNFHALAVKLGKEAPAHPLFFIKPSTTVIGTGTDIQRPASYAGKIAYEGELGIVIGKPCKAVPESVAAEHIFGYTCVNDVTAIELLNENPDFPQWCRSKSYDTFCGLGPVIQTQFDLNAHVRTLLDGVERQHYALSDMIMPPSMIVSRISQDMTLLPGDVIACGTSLGVGSIKAGAQVEVIIEGIGTLRNRLAPG